MEVMQVQMGKCGLVGGSDAVAWTVPLLHVISAELRMRQKHTPGCTISEPFRDLFCLATTTHTQTQAPSGVTLSSHGARQLSSGWETPAL